MVNKKIDEKKFDNTMAEMKFDTIVESLIEFGTFIFPYSGDKEGQIYICLSISFRRFSSPLYLKMYDCGTIGRGNLYVGMLKEGTGFIFDLFTKKHVSYIKEKLKLGICEAQWVADLLEKLRNSIKLRKAVDEIDNEKLEEE